MAKRPWRVLYTPDADHDKHRSKPFDTEEEALRWARDFVRSHGVRASTHIYAKAMDEDPGIDPVPASHRVAWVNGAVSTMSWPQMPREQYLRWNRQMIDSYGGDYVGPQWVPEYLEKAKGPLPGPRRMD